jgi:spore coat polysaccharide biosynthesis protein SpsF
LPEKIFKRLGNRFLIDIIIDRLKQTNLDEIYLLTSDRQIDDHLAEYCSKTGCKVFRGCYEDLTVRTLEAVECLKVDKFLRVNGDSPFVSPQLINYALKLQLNINFISNLYDRTFPYGVALELLDSNFFRQKANLRSREAKEHLTMHLYDHLFNTDILSITQNIDLSEHRLTIDTQDDYNRLINVFDDDHLIEYWNYLNYPKPQFNFKHL